MPLGLLRAFHVVFNSSLVSPLDVLSGRGDVGCSSSLWVHGVPMISLMNSKAAALLSWQQPLGLPFN